MRLKEIYRPIEKELINVEKVIKDSLKNGAYGPVLEMSDYLLNTTTAKRLRPALVLISAKAIDPPSATDDHVIKMATAVELIHMGSLIHDDLIDNSSLRHNKATINHKWGQDASIALGDYIYSIAFDLISESGNADVIRCISSAIRTMCEGELLQVSERDNLNLLKERYISIVTKKTASLFAASCQVGALMSRPYKSALMAMRGYGLNFGIAFQIIDDYKDLTGEETILGKRVGQDIRAGEVTLPILNLWESLPGQERKELEALLSSGKNGEALQEIRKKLIDSESLAKTKEMTASFINSAKWKVETLSSSPYKESLLNLADFVMERGFSDYSC